MSDMAFALVDSGSKRTIITVAHGVSNFLVFESIVKAWDDISLEQEERERLFCDFLSFLLQFEHVGMLRLVEDTEEDRDFDCWTSGETPDFVHVFEISPSRGDIPGLLVHAVRPVRNYGDNTSPVDKENDSPFSWLELCDTEGLGVSFYCQVGNPEVRFRMNRHYNSFVFKHDGTGEKTLKMW